MTQTLGEHLRRVVDSRLRVLSECRDFAAERDPVEALHDLRVASRRLRAVIDVYEPLLGHHAQKRAGKPLRRLTRAIRTLRDWDVQAGLVGERLNRTTSDSERAALEHLLETIERPRRKEARRAEKRLSRIDFGDVRDLVRVAVDKVVAELPSAEEDARRLSYKLVEPFVTTLEQGEPPNDGIEHIEALHAFRIDAKRLRYALELFEPMLGESYPSVATRIRMIQEVIGTHRDLVVLDSLFAEVEGNLERRERRTLGAAFLTLRDELDQERRALFEKFDEEGLIRAEWRQRISACFAPIEPAG